MPNPVGRVTECTVANTPSDPDRPVAVRPNSSLRLLNGTFVTGRKALFILASLATMFQQHEIPETQDSDRIMGDLRAGRPVLWHSCDQADLASDDPQ